MAVLFKLESPLYATQIERKEGENVLYVNYLPAPFVPSLAKQASVMGRTVDMLVEHSNVSRIMFVQQRNYHYPSEQVLMLAEIARIVVYFLKQEAILSPEKLRMFGDVGGMHAEISSLITMLKQDPIACYREIGRRLQEARYQLGTGEITNKGGLLYYLNFLEKFHGMLEKTKLLQKVLNSSLDSIGGRSIYGEIFKPDMLPNFTFTRLVAQMPEDAEFIDQYELKQEDEAVTVTILKKKNDAKYFYHIMPLEYGLNEEHYLLLHLARNVLIEHKPEAEEFVDPERTRQVFFNVARDLLSELSKNKGIELTHKELQKLANILVRHTIGFGMIEVLLFDNNLQDIILNAPIAQNPIFVRHQKYDECATNIIPSYEDADSWAAKLRLQSGRALDEANPVLDCDLTFGNIRARIAAVSQPLSPFGLAYAFRRHREQPWTLPLFVQNKMLNSFAAGLLSFLIDGARTVMVAGTRSSGKCVDGDTLIQLSDGRIIKIKNMLGEKKREIDDGQIYEPINKMRAASLSNMKIGEKNITDVWKRNSPERVIKIRTGSGKEIITTKEHPYFIYSKGIKQIRADSLSKGSLIVTPRTIKTNSKEAKIDLRNCSDFIQETNDFFILKGRTNSQIIRFPKKVTSELAEFIGLIIGDGHIDKTKIEFHNNCRELREKYIAFIKNLGVNYRVFSSRNTMVVQISSRTLSKILSEIFDIPLGNKSDKIRIPELILKSSNDVLAAFLRGYFDTDGYCPKEKRDLELATASKRMSEELSMALLRLGIIAFKKTRIINNNPYYRILIRGEFAETFIREIGFSHPKKRERAELLMVGSHLDNTNTDVIPEGNRILRELRKTFRASPKQHRESGKDYWAYENNKYRVSRKWFNKITAFYETRYENLKLMENKAEILRRIANFDVKNYFNKIEELRHDLGLSYNGLALETELSGRGVRKILYNARFGSLETLNKFLGGLELAPEMAMVSSFAAGMILTEFRNELNISNEELGTCGISATTVTNIFTGKCIPRFETLQRLAKKILEIYESAVSEKSLAVLSEAKNLATSDIFWDEIISIEEINKVDDYVYDLSVEDTHNFVANGIIAHNTSLLGSLLLEIMPKYRIIVVEDTPELPIGSLRKIGYDILGMKVRSALTSGTTEVEASEGIRTSLRLGDSALIVGEVRSEEAKALYEAMRIGALANVVAGTIHGDSPYGVFDRVVNDLNVPATSFKATDLIIIANPVKTPDGLHSMKRVVSVTEVRKHWEKDPEQEGGFVELLRYNVEKDELEPTPELMNGDSEIIKSIAGNVRGWAGNWDAVFDNILLRAKIKQETVRLAESTGKPALLECDFNSISNAMFHRISDEVVQEDGLPLSEKVFPRWYEWAVKEAKRF